MRATLDGWLLALGENRDDLDPAVIGCTEGCEDEVLMDLDGFLRVIRARFHEGDYSESPLDEVVDRCPSCDFAALRGDVAPHIERVAHCCVRCAHSWTVDVGPDPTAPPETEAFRRVEEVFAAAVEWARDYGPWDSGNPDHVAPGGDLLGAALYNALVRWARAGRPMPSNADDVRMPDEFDEGRPDDALAIAAAAMLRTWRGVAGYAGCTVAVAALADALDVYRAATRSRPSFTRDSSVRLAKACERNATLCAVADIARRAGFSMTEGLTEMVVALEAQYERLFEAAVSGALRYGPPPVVMPPDGRDFSAARGMPAAHDEWHNCETCGSSWRGAGPCPACAASDQPKGE